MPSIQQIPIDKTTGMLKKSAKIFYSVRPCPLGQLLVAVTERGICKVSLGASAGNADGGDGSRIRKG